MDPFYRGHFSDSEFIESVTSGLDGTVYATNLFEGVIYKIQDDETSTLIDFDGSLAGITILDDQNLVATGSDSNMNPVLLLINTETGSIVNEFIVADALLLNDVVKLNESSVLIADSFKGVIWKADLISGESSIWSDDPLLASPAPSDNVPGVNGIKIFENNVYISDSGKMLLAKVSIENDGTAGISKIHKENVFVDDFTFDSLGNIYGATHTFDSVIRISTEGVVSIIAQADQGVIGSTCLTWKSGAEDTLLVSSNGGMLNEDQSSVVSAKIVDLQIK